MARRLIQPGQPAPPQERVEFRQARVDSGKDAVVIAAVAVLAAYAYLPGHVVVVGRDDPAFARDEQLRGAEAEDARVAFAPQRRALVQRTEPVRGVEDQSESVAFGDFG